jgi:hypothetical protein
MINEGPIMSRSVGSPPSGGRFGHRSTFVASLAITFVALVGAASVARAGEPSLPRQFSVEVGPGGTLFADGTRLGAPSELARWAQRAAAGARFAGAVVFGDPERDAAAVAQAVELLQKAGFSEVRGVGRPAPAALSAARASGAAPVVGAIRAPLGPATAVAAPSPKPAAAAAVTTATRPRSVSGGPPVSLMSMGLHVDGLLNREPHRGRLVRVFEREFPAFKRCHGRAAPHTEGASYGVDLLIPSGGGRAKVRDTRTRLEGAGFGSCMRAAFEAIRFPAPPSERPEIVSYSVLFKPGGR